jgi:BirA family biotin operon repressor/biotin-[acetyl-CoA-carboxylase] ligase
MQKAFAVLERLQDGRAHSGEDIAADLGVSRAAVWNQIKRLQAEGVEVHAVSGKGYRLPGGYEFLDREAINANLRQSTATQLREVHIDRVTDSTNQRLLDLIPDQNIHGVVWMAEHQTRGRGRRGGSWLAPPGSGLCLSLGWCFDSPPKSLSALSLVVGVSIIRALGAIGASGLKLKWPNDIYHDERKLAGILIEMRAEIGGPCTIAIGVGINLTLSPDARNRINEPVTDVSAACVASPSRNAVVGAVLDQLVDVLNNFKNSGFEPYRSEWQSYDLLRDRKFRLEGPDRIVEGIGRGVGPEGTLLIEHDGDVEAFMSGHIVMDGSP